MFRRSPRAALLWVAAGAVALATSVHVAGLLSSLERQDREFGRVRTVVVAARDLPLGTRVDVRDLALRRIRGHAVEPRALADRGAATGTVVRVPLLRGAVVTARHVADGDRGARSATVPAGMRAMRVGTAGSTRPEPGDVVDVYATFDPQVLGDDGDPTITIATAAPVVAVGSSGVTVLVTPEQAKRIAFAGAVGSLSLAIAPPEEAREPHG